MTKPRRSSLVSSLSRFLPEEISIIEEKDQEVLRLCVNACELHRRRPAHELTVKVAQRQGLAGATVLRCITGFGPDGKVHTLVSLHLIEDIPVVIEIVDSAGKLDAFMGFVNEVAGEGFATRMKVAARCYGEGARRPKD